MVLIDSSQNIYVQQETPSNNIKYSKDGVNWTLINTSDYPIHVNNTDISGIHVYFITNIIVGYTTLYFVPDSENIVFDGSYNTIQINNVPSFPGFLKMEPVVLPEKII